MRFCLCALTCLLVLGSFGTILPSSASVQTVKPFQSNLLQPAPIPELRLQQPVERDLQAGEVHAYPKPAQYSIHNRRAAFVLGGLAGGEARSAEFRVAVAKGNW